MFAGVGGFRLGLERLGWKCVGWCEIDKYARQTYEANFDTKGEFFWSDATSLNTSEMPDFDVLVGGFPCQSFSLAGLRLGFEDARGTLFFELVRVLRDKKPRAFLFENVQGLVFHDKGRTLSTILDLLAATVNGQARLSPNANCLGYHVYWRVLNSKDFGVPQSRKRIFIVGFKDSLSKPFTFPEGGRLADLLEDVVDEKYYLSPKLVESLVRHLAEKKNGSTIALEERRVKRVGNVFPSEGQAEQVVDKSGISPTIVLGKRGGSAIMPIVQNERKVKEIGNVYPSGGQAGRVYDGSECSPTVRSEAKGTGQTAIIIAEPREEEKSSATDTNDITSYTIPHYKKGGGSKPQISRGFSPTLTARMGNSGQNIPVVQEPKWLAEHLRRLTPRECARLQGFPDSFVLPCSDTQSYRQMGNAVTVNVVEAVGRKMTGVLSS